jgi:hypothetical protein
VSLRLGLQAVRIKHLFERVVAASRVDIVQVYDEHAYDEQVFEASWRLHMTATTLEARPQRLRVQRTEAGRTLRLTLRGRVVVAVLAVLVVAVSFLSGTRAAARTAPSAIPVAAVTVVSGQTLWQIASTITEPGQDVRDVIDEIMAINGLGSADLRAGQQLLVPDRGQIILADGASHQ